MAKWGEGDPRWLVEERQDGANVNGWHWEEKNKLEWSKQRLAELFTDIQAAWDAAEGQLAITGLKDVTGEASITTRKGGKRFAVFDLKISLDWQGQLVGDEKLVKGTILIEEVHSTGDESDYVYSTTAEGTGASQDKCKKVAESMKSRVYELIGQFIQELEGQA